MMKLYLIIGLSCVDIIAIDLVPLSPYCLDSKFVLEAVVGGFPLTPLVTMGMMMVI